MHLSFMMQTKADRWLLSAQRSGGGWGGGISSPASVEETALALDTLAMYLDDANPRSGGTDYGPSIAGALEWLLAHVESGEWIQPSPIGFYFAKLWYYERLYPIIFTVGALNRVEHVLRGGSP